MSAEDLRLIWNEINLDVMADNMRKIKNIVKAPYIAAVIKADAYGHGSVGIAQTLLNNGATHLAVARLTEALELRKYGIKAPIFLLGYVEPEGALLLIKNDITMGIYNYEHAKVFSKAAGQLNKTAHFHIVVDTGMKRIGFQPTDESVEEIIKISQLPNVELEGIFTHFSMADGDDLEYTDYQFNLFNEFIAKLAARNIHFKIRHCGNSAAILREPKYHMDMVRAGVIMYGISPAPNLPVKELGLTPAMSFKCKITHVKDIYPGDGVSYGHTYVAKEKRRVATIPVGYADGYPRTLSNLGDVLIHGKRARILGNICMDQCMVDITDIPDVKVGDEAVLFGSQGEETILVDELAEKINTINYEIPCMLARRVPKYYYKNGKMDFYRYYIDSL